MSTATAGRGGITDSARLANTGKADTREEMRYEERPAPDGYTRMTHVQAIKIDPQYRPRIIRRCVGAAVFLAVAAVAVYFAIRYL
ncbi:MAG: hypothetical protein LBJ84_02830 [Oscillospiraceae bacterium]|nr:hypothetical protein [Oscillospiraceae bacterium]